MADRLVLVAGDTGPDLELTVRRLGRPYPIPVGAAVSVRVEREANATITKAATIVDAERGLVRVQWGAGDLAANGNKPATYVITTRVLEAGGDVHHDGAPLRAIVRPLDEGLAAMAPGPAPELGAILTAAMAALDLELDNHRSGATQDHALAHLSDVTDAAPANLNVLRRVGGTWQGVDLFAGVPVPADLALAAAAGASTTPARADHVHSSAGLATDAEIVTADALAVHKAGAETITGSKTFTTALLYATGVLSATYADTIDLPSNGAVVRRAQLGYGIVPGVGAVPGVALGNDVALYRSNTLRLATVGGLDVNSPASGSVPLVARGFAGQTGNLLQLQDSASAILARVNAQGYPTFGSDSVFVQSTGLVASSVTADASTKSYRFGVSHFTNAEEPLALIMGTSLSTSGIVLVGGGSSLYNAATQVSLFTAADTVTTSGTEWVRLDSAGRLAVGVPTFLTGQVNVIPTDVARIGLLIRGAASQTADLTQWQNSAGTVLAKVRSDGALGAPFLTDVAEVGPYLTMGTTGVNITTRATAQVGLILQAGFGGQTGDLTQWRNSAGTVLARVAADGRVGIGTPSTNGTGALSVIPLATGQQGVVIRGQAAQAGDLLRAEGSSGTALATITAAGTGLLSGLAVKDGTTGVPANVKAFIEATAGGTAPLVLRLAAGPSANALEVQNNAGGLLARFGPTGILGVDRIESSGGTNPYVLMGQPAITFVAAAAGQVPVVVRGATTQTADLQRWTDDVGTVLSLVNATGRVAVGRVSVPSGATVAVTPFAVGDHGLVLRAITGQTGNSLLVQSDVGATVANITAAGDVAANRYRITGGAGASSAALDFRVSGDAQFRYSLDVDGTTRWGPGGAAAMDTNLYRSAADTLKTDDAFHVAGAFRHLGATAGFFGAAAVAQPAGVPDAAGGATVDAEARAAVNAVITRLETLGLLATV